jgi:hypothetical protein
LLPYGTKLYAQVVSCCKQYPSILVFSWALEGRAPALEGKARRQLAAERTLQAQPQIDLPHSRIAHQYSLHPGSNRACYPWTLTRLCARRKCQAQQLALVLRARGCGPSVEVAVEFRPPSGANSSSSDHTGVCFAPMTDQVKLESNLKLDEWLAPIKPKSNGSDSSSVPTQSKPSTVFNKVSTLAKMWTNGCSQW